MSAVELEDNIWIAASDGKLDLVKAFVASGVAVNAQDENGYSPIHAASSWGEYCAKHAAYRGAVYRQAALAR